MAEVSAGLAHGMPHFPVPIDPVVLGVDTPQLFFRGFPGRVEAALEPPSVVCLSMIIRTARSRNSELNSFSFVRLETNSGRFSACGEWICYRNGFG